MLKRPVSPFTSFELIGHAAWRETPVLCTRRANEGLAYAATLGFGLFFAAIGIVLLRFLMNDLKECATMPKTTGYRVYDEVKIVLAGCVFVMVLGEAGIPSDATSRSERHPAFMQQIGIETLVFKVIRHRFGITGVGQIQEGDDGIEVIRFHHITNRHHSAGFLAIST